MFINKIKSKFYECNINVGGRGELIKIEISYRGLSDELLKAQLLVAPFPFTPEANHNLASQLMIWKVNLLLDIGFSHATFLTCFGYEL